MSYANRDKKHRPLKGRDLFSFDFMKTNPSKSATLGAATVAGRCPMRGEDFDPFDLSDPFPSYQRLRAETPVFYEETIGYWIVSRYADIKAVFEDFRTFSAENAQAPMRPLCETAKQVLKRADFTAYSGLSARVPPDHTRIRKAVSSAFTPRRYRALAPLVRDTVDAMLDAMLAKPKGDLVADLAYDLPALTMLTLLGVEAEKVAEVKRWAKSRVLLTWGNVSDAEEVAHAENLVAYWNYCLAVVAARHARRMDDLPGDLVALQQEGVEITDHEIASFCYSLLTAGHETTTNLIANGLLALLRHRQAWIALVADKAKIPGAIEEILRYAQSVVAWRRKVKAATSIGGVQIPEGANLLLLLASANRDEQVFVNGEQFDIERENARTHVSFGYGIHFCPGSSLAKMQLQIVIEELTARVPTLRLAPDQTIDYARNTSFRAPDSILVEWDR
jgi:cytochrome P450